MKLFCEQLLLFCHREMHKKSSQRKNGILFDRHFSPGFSSALLNLGAVLQAFKKSSLRLLGRAAGASSTVL